MQEITVNNENTPLTGAGSLEDRIKSASLANYESLKNEIAATGSAVVREVYIEKLAGVLGVKPSTLAKEIGAEAEKSDAVELCAVFPELVDLVEDGAGKVGYLVKQPDGIGYAELWQKPNGSTCYPPGKEHLQFKLGNSKRVQEHYARNEDPARLYDDLVAYFKRFSYLPEDTWPVIAFSVMLSYLQDHQDVRYVPVIYFYAVAERGKSRTAKSMLSVSYRGVHLGDMNNANIFRYAENLNATLFLDCTDLWKTATKASGEDILLNRFEKGATVSRVLHPDRGAFHDQVHYRIFGSTIVATNEPANVTFETRCLPVTMPNRPGEYENGTPEMGVPLKERLIAWRARMMDQHLPELRPVGGISGRLWDISKPLFQLCQMIKPEVMDVMAGVVAAMADKRAEDKKDSVEGQIVKAIAAIADFEGQYEVALSQMDILNELNLLKDQRFKMSPVKLGNRLNSLSVRKRTVNGCRQVVITRSELELLMHQYGLSVESGVQVIVNFKDDSGRDVEGGRGLLEPFDDVLCDNYWPDDDELPDELKNFPEY